MKSAIIAAVSGLAASAVAQTIGKAVVVNYCTEDIYIQNTPCGTGEQYGPTTLDDGYKQTWTTTINGGTACGWSIKIGDSPDLTGPIMQYEYTYEADSETIWWDMSLVNAAQDASGNAISPYAYTFESDNSTCVPNEKFFGTPTGDGMQPPCAQEVTLTLTLCGADANNGTGSFGSSSSSSAISSYSTSTAAGSSSTSSAVNPYSSAAASSSSASASKTTFATSASSAPASSSSAASSASSSGYGHSWGGVVKEANVQAQTTAITTSSASVTTSTAANGNVATEVVVDYVTEIATAYVTERDAQPTPVVHRRHTHGHPHGPHHA